MFSQEFLSTLFHIPSLLGLIGTMLICAVLLTPLEYYFPAHPQPTISRKGLMLDFAYWFLTPIVTRTFTSLVILILLYLIFSITGRAVDESLLEGYGPISRQPLAFQAIEILLLADFIDYWTHRAFHKKAFWNFHAIHHSPEEMSWMSSARVHPVNDLVTRTFQVLPLASLGFAAHAIILIAPFLSVYVMFLHSNISWDFGPFRKVLVSPAYHRWHHTSDKEAIDKNFAGIFPLWDWLFGTMYVNDDLPKNYGLVGTSLAENLYEHILYPFKALGYKKALCPKSPQSPFQKY
jgi:sterol desaturase/sphingolipid hydroxylase (fatty acid hydroxylase superfamily)